MQLRWCTRIRPLLLLMMRTSRSRTRRRGGWRRWPGTTQDVSGAAVGRPPPDRPSARSGAGAKRAGPAVQRAAPEDVLTPRCVVQDRTEGLPVEIYFRLSLRGENRPRFESCDGWDCPAAERNAS